MIWKIARKELLNNLLTLRFAIGTALVLALTIIFSSVLISDYRRQKETYDKFVSHNQAALAQVLTYQNLRPTIYKPPEILSVFSRGIEENVAKEADISVDEIPALSSASTAKNPLLAVFSVLEVALVFKLVVSVLALLLAYDAISGEKEDGTLRLMLSNHVPRYQIISGKFLGGLLTLAIPIVLAFLPTIVMIVSSPLIALSIAEWGRILLMFLASLLLVAVFLNISLFISSLTKRASDTLMVLLFIWVVFLLIVPNVSSYLASQLNPVELGGKINSQIRETRANFQKKAQETISQIPDPGGYRVESDAQETWGGYIKLASAAEIRFQQETNKRLMPLGEEFVREVGELNDKYIDQLIAQKKWAESLARISPISLYESLISGLARTDVSSMSAFAQQARDYRQQTMNYLEQKRAFSSLRYFTTMTEDMIFDVRNIEEYRAIYKKYGEYQPKPLDLSDLPQFRYRQEGIQHSLTRILPNLLALTFLAIIFFVCAFVAMLKYDVR